MYDVIIIGGGVIGCSVARFLSQYKGNFLLLERHNDVGEETTNANSGIVHSGYDPLPGTKKAYFNVKGCKMMPKISEELDVPFKKNGSLTIGFNETDLKTLTSLLERAKENNVNAEILNYDELHKMEPNLNKECKYALYCKDAGIISPFNLCVSFMENAMDNGVKLNLNTEVAKIEKIDDFYRVFTKNNEIFDTKVLINCTGTSSDLVTNFIEKPTFKITPKKGVYILFDHFDQNFVHSTLFMCPTELGKGVLFSPTTSNNYFIGPNSVTSDRCDTSTDKNSFDYIKQEAKRLIPDLPLTEVIREFAGVRANNDSDDFIIEESKTNKNFINVAGISSPGLASSPAIGEYVANYVKDKLHLEINKEFNPYIRKHLKANNVDELNELIKKDKKYGHIICRCEQVSEGAIIDVINRNCGARTVKGVKKRIRAGFGKCQGTFCQDEVIKILARELNLSIEDIKYSDVDTTILKYQAKGK